MADGYDASWLRGVEPLHQGRAKPPLPEDDGCPPYLPAEAYAEEAASNVMWFPGSGPAPARSSQWVCAADLEGLPIPERNWLVPDLIPARNVTLLYGDGGTGKSLLALQLAVAVATGGIWIGQPVKAGRAIFPSAEDETDELHRRLVDIASCEGVRLADLQNLTIRSLAGEDALLARLGGTSGPLVASDLYREIEALLEAERPALLVLDTLADMFPGNENDKAQARQFVGLLKGLAILGGAPTLAIMDERASWEREKGDNLENAILSGLGKRGGRALIISTSAPDDANTFSRWMDDAPPGTYVQEHRPSPGLPADDLASLLIANPGAAEGIGATAEWLVAQARRAIARGGSALSSFRNLNRNERVASDDRSVLVTVDEWLGAEVAPDALPPRSGPCVLGVDLGGSRSMSAAAFYWPDTGRLEALGTFPATPSLGDRGAADGVAGRYGEMFDRGELSVMGEATVPPGPWLADIARQLDSAEIACIAGDRFRFAEFTEALRAAGLDRVPLINRGFGWKDGSEDIERFRRALFDGEVAVAPSLLLRSAFADAITLVDPAGNHKLAKARSLGRIDAAAAVVLAVAEGMRRKAAPTRKARVAWL